MIILSITNFSSKLIKCFVLKTLESMACVILSNHIAYVRAGNASYHNRAAGHAAVLSSLRQEHMSQPLKKAIEKFATLICLSNRQGQINRQGCTFQKKIINGQVSIKLFNIETLLIGQGANFLKI